MATSSIFETPTFTSRKAAASLAEAIKKSEKASISQALEKHLVARIASTDEVNDFFRKR